jgi:dTDP-4-dehydrorhamnose reductase
MDFKMEIKKILVTGSAGLIGTQIVKDLLDNHKQVYSCYNKTKPELGIITHLDLTKKDDIVNTMNIIKPDVVIHLGAMTDVELCETETELAKKINTDATEILALESEKYNTFFVYMSTDYVFDGKVGMKKENDKTNPINFYGKSKLDGERVFKKITTPNVIVRTSTPFGLHSKKISFPIWVKKNLELEKEISVVINQYTSPSYVPNISKMIIEIMERKITGIIHLAGDIKISRYDFAIKIAEILNIDKKFLKPIKIEQMNWKAQRPKDSSLDVSKAKKLLKNKPETIEKSLQLYFSNTHLS